MTRSTFRWVGAFKMQSTRRSFVLLLRILVLVTAGLTLSCFEKPEPACALLCGADNACPTGYECRADGWCKRSDIEDSFVCQVDAPPTIDGSM